MRYIIASTSFKIDAASDRLRALMSPYKPYHVHPPSPAMRFFFEIEIGIAVFILIAYAIYLARKQWQEKKKNTKKNELIHFKRRRKHRRHQ